METLRYLLCLTLLLLPGLTAAAELKRLPATAKITAVTVYPDRAATSRQATLTLKPGSYLVIFDHLPVLLEDDSVRIEGQGSAAVTIAGLEIKRAFLAESGEERIKALDEEIRVLEARSGGVEAKKSGLAAQKAFLESIRVAWGERISKELAVGRPTAAELQEAAGLVGNGISKIQEQALALTGEQQTLRNKIDALRRQRDESIGSRRQESKSVEVTLDVAREGGLTLTLTTLLPQAGWVPTYDVRLGAEAKNATLTFRALVRQQTGEDWNAVDVTLSTARPATGGTPPELSPWHIALFRPQPPRPEATLYRGAAAPAMLSKQTEYSADAAGIDEFLAAEAAVETAQLSAEQSSVAFHIPRPLDIPADGSEHGSVVALAELPVRMTFLAIPKLTPAVFLKAEMVNQGAYPLLPGKVNTFVGNTYTGSAQLRKVAAGETFDLFFGSDDQLTVKRDEVKQHKEAGVFGRNRASYRYRIEVQNLRKEAVTVTLRDQLPLADDAEIKIALEEPTLKPEEVRDDGRITWKMPLEAGEKKELSFGLMVEYPKEREVTGL